VAEGTVTRPDGRTVAYATWGDPDGRPLLQIHGTPGSIGGADSHGCLRASDPDMIALFARVPLGAPVFIRA
jgi:lipoprotein-anchoring transpeptidase ErfK/SrfK